MKAEELLEKTPSELRQIAGEQLGVKLAVGLTKQQMANKILQVDQAQKEAAKEQTEATAKEMQSKKDPLLSVRFQQIESPGADVDFTVDLDGKGNRSFHLYDGQVVKLPVSIINHLNRLAVPNPHYEVDPESRQLTSVVRGVRNRFACIPQSLMEDLDLTGLAQAQR